MAYRSYNQIDTIFLKGPIKDIRQYGESFDAQVMINAISDIGTNETALVIPPHNWAVDQTVHFPSNIAVYTPLGVHFNISSSVTLEFDSLISGDYQIFFTNPSNVTVNCPCNRALWGEANERVQEIVDADHFYVKELSDVPPTKPGYSILCFTDDGKIHAIDSSGNDVLAASYAGTNVLNSLLTVDGAGSGLDADLLDGQEGSYYLPVGSYTAADILAKLETVDGSGTGLDADLLDGQEGSYYLPAGSYTAVDVLTKIKTVDGASSGLDADLLDGLDSTNLAKSQNASSTDLNTLINSGVYKLGGSNANMPSDVAYGQVLVVHGDGDTIAQIAFGYQNNNIYWRSGSPNEVGGTGSWGAWVKVWNTNNDGAGSGLDADLLDGKESGDFLSAIQWF